MKSVWLDELNTLTGKNIEKHAYKLYENGDIFSYKGFKSNGKTFMHFISDKPVKKLKPSKTKKGYLIIRISDIEGNKVSLSMHRLVAQAFVKNSENKPQVNHIDCNKENNDASNLEWVTNKENHKHKLENGLNISLSGKEHYTHRDKRYKNWHHGNRRVAQYAKNGELIEVFESLKEAEKKTGINYTGISKTINGHISQAGGYIWKYYNN